MAGSSCHTVSHGVSLWDVHEAVQGKSLTLPKNFFKIAVSHSTIPAEVLPLTPGLFRNVVAPALSNSPAAHL